MYGLSAYSLSFPSPPPPPPPPRLLLPLLSLSLSSLAHTKAYVHIAYESAHCGRGHGDVCVLHYVHDVQRHMNTWHVSVTFCADT